MSILSGGIAVAGGYERRLYTLGYKAGLYPIVYKAYLRAPRSFLADRSHDLGDEQWQDDCQSDKRYPDHAAALREVHTRRPGTTAFVFRASFTAARTLSAHAAAAATPAASAPAATPARSRKAALAICLRFCAFSSCTLLSANEARF